MVSLFELGFGSFFAEQAASGEVEEGRLARVSAEHRAGFEVWAEQGEAAAKLSGRLRRVLSGEGLPGVGDWVVLRTAPVEGEPAVIERVLDRRTVFVRAAAGRASVPQVVAANVDWVLVVTGLDEDFNVHRVERCLARVAASGASPIVVLSKADLCDDVAARIAEVAQRAPSVPVVATSALRGDGIEVLDAYATRGQTLALIGSSGAGKSTLVNALLGATRMATGAVRARDGRGCHTTSHRQLIALPGGGILLDTPGMREIHLYDASGLDSVFSDVDQVAGQCRFTDCTHSGEPGCAVQEALERGDLDADRVAHYDKLRREAQAFEMRHDARLRKKNARMWGQLHAEVAMQRRLKNQS